MKISLINESFNAARKENRPALITYTVAGDYTKKKIIGNSQINFKICRYL